jgi:SAM-dependent methyltransferase
LNSIEFITERVFHLRTPATLSAWRQKGIAPVLACLLAICSAAKAASVVVGPYVHFYNRGEVTVFWKTDAPVASIIDYGMKPDLSQRVEDPTPKTDHELAIPVRPATVYTYRIDAGGTTTATYEFYSAFDYGPDPFPAGPSPYPPDSLTALYEQAAQYIADQLQFAKGYCIVYGCGEGRLAYEIAKRTDLKIIGFEEQAGKVAAARAALHQADVYGSRITVLQASLSALPCSDFSANLVVSETAIAQGTCPGTAAEMFRILRPAGGVAILGQPPGCPNPLSRTALENWLNAGGLTYTITEDTNGLWAHVNRAPLSGAGEWSHPWANPAATTCSEDTAIAYPVQMLWFGEPGPRYIIDRHHRPGCSLYKDGHLVVPGLHRVMAMDAYNGARLWDVAVPSSGRVGVMKDAGWVVLASDYAYLAASDDCVGLDAHTGRPTLFFQASQQIPGQTCDWGYLATDGDLLFGSGQKAGASRIGHSFDLGADGYISQVYHDNQPIVTSRYLFCFDRHNTTAPLWVYKYDSGANSVIINPAICVSNDAVYFVESRNPAAVSDIDGRVTLSVLLDSNYEYLVKLNRNTGAIVWQQQVNLPFQHVIWLHYADNKVLATGTSGGSPWSHSIYAFRVSDGALDPAWTTNPVTFTAAMSDDYHGGQDKHPAIVGSSIYWQPSYKYNLTTGALQSWGGVGQGGCGTINTSANYAFNRSGNPGMHSLSGGSWGLCSETRVGCYINIVPAGGLVLVPESGSGCTCGYPLQASMAFQPQ